jgi:hypothetical protein
MFKDIADAKKHYEEALATNPNNAVALRGLWLLEYDQEHLGKSLMYLNKLDTISRFHIFQPHMYDLKLQKVLSNICFKRWNIFWAIRHAILLKKFRMRNNKMLKKNYAL